jgi:hypothetical protein
MDLLDDFDRVRATFSELGAIGQRIDSTLAEEPGSSSLNVASTSYDLPGLSVEPTVRQAARWVILSCTAQLQQLQTCHTKPSGTTLLQQLQTCLVKP